MDRFSPSSVLPLLDSVNPVTKGLYLTTLAKIESGIHSVSPRYSYGSFESNAPLIALSGWSRARKIILCGEKGQQGYICHCNMPRWCNKCAWRSAARIYSKFSKSYGKAPYWYAITYSFTSNLFLNETNKETYLARWNQAHSFLLALKAEGLINGAFSVNELSIVNITNLTVFPHTHIVCNSDWDNLVDSNGVLHDTIAAEASKAGVSIKVQPILSSLSLVNELKYPIKAINLQNLYQSEAINTPCDQINASFDRLMTILADYEHKVIKVHYYGNMAAHSPSNYIGSRLKKDAHKKSTKTLKSKGNTSTIKPVQYTKAASMTPITSAMPPQKPQGTPPAPPRRFTLPRLLGAAGAGASILGGADLLFNKGRILQGGLTSLKNLINGTAPTLPPAPQSVSDRVADLSAGYTGTSAGHVTPDQFTKMVGMSPAQLPDSHVNATAFNDWKNSVLLKGNNSLESMTPAAAQGWFQNFYSRNPDAFTTPNPTGDLSKMPKVTPSPELLFKLMEADVANGATRKGMGLDAVREWVPSVDSVGAALDKAYTADGALGLGLLGGQGVAKFAPGTGLGKKILASQKALGEGFFSGLGRLSSGIGSAVATHSLATNPLVQEVQQSAADELGTPIAHAVANQHANVATGAAGALGAALPPAGALGAVIGTAGDAWLNNEVNYLRNAAAHTGETGAFMDVLSRLDRGAGNNPHYRQAIRNVLTSLERSPGSSNHMEADPVAKMLLDRVKQYR